MYVLIYVCMHVCLYVQVGYSELQEGLRKLSSEHSAPMQVRHKRMRMLTRNTYFCGKPDVCIQAFTHTHKHTSTHSHEHSYRRMSLRP